MKNGWVKIHRKLLDKGYYKKSKYIHLWVHLLLKANHEPKEFMFNNEIIIIKEGQLLTGRKQLSKETGISETTLERILTFFTENGEIGQQKTSKFRLITVIKWKDYQIVGQQTDNKRTTNGQQTDTNKNVKKNKNIKNTNIIATKTVAGINQVMDLFHNSINPTINYGNKTTRKATADLIKQFGLERTVELTKYAISVQGKDYAPTITTPYQLKEKLSQLKIYADKSKKSLIQDI